MSGTEGFVSQKYLLLILLSVTNAWAHAPAPSGVGGNLGGHQSCTGLTVHHAGMGGLATNEGQASSTLRRQCTQAQLDRDRTVACSAFERGNIVISGLEDFPYNLPTDGRTLQSFDSGMVATTEAYLRTYISEVVESEYLGVKDILDKRDFQIDAFAPRPMQCTSDGVEPPHRILRNVQRTTPQLASATILGAMYGMNQQSSYYFFTTTTPEYTPYMQRLQRSYPALFQPRNRTEPLVSLMRQYMGDGFKADRQRSATYEETFDAFETLYMNNEEFSHAFDDATDEIFDDYRAFLQTKMATLCNTSLQSLISSFPGIFDQALLDMTPEQRAIANLHLCRKPYYYNATTNDSDCDGQADKADSEPLDPFKPNAKFSRKGTAMQDPPYGSDYDYAVERDAAANTVKLKTQLTFDYSGMSSADRTLFEAKLVKCKQKLATSLTGAFDQLKTTVPYLDSASALELDINFVPSAPGGGDFKMHSCYCTDCPNVADPETGFYGLGQSYIPKSKCLADLTAAQKTAIAAARPGETVENIWRTREDAGNLTGGSSCHTIVHEVYHRLGLPDEYVDQTTYPYNQVGCNIMGEGSTMKLEPRQLQSILSPVTCR